MPAWEAWKLAIAKKRIWKKYPVSLTHFPSLDRPVTGGTFNQRSTIATTSFVNLTNNGSSHQRTHPILYEKYNLKIKSTKMQCHWMGLHYHLSITDPCTKNPQHYPRISWFRQNRKIKIILRYKRYDLYYLWKKQIYLPSPRLYAVVVIVQNPLDCQDVVIHNFCQFLAARKANSKYEGRTHLKDNVTLLCRHVFGWDMSTGMLSKQNLKDFKGNRHTPFLG